MVTIDDLLVKQYILAFDPNSFYSRYIFKTAKLELLGRVDKQEEYSLVTCDGLEFKLYHNPISGAMTIYIGGANSRLLTVTDATNDFIRLLQEGDVILYNQPNAPPVVAKVDLYQEKYGRFLMDCLGGRHNLSTVLKRFGKSNITAIITRDSRHEKVQSYAT